MFTKEIFFVRIFAHKINKLVLGLEKRVIYLLARIFMPVPVILLRHFYLHVDLQNKCLGIHPCNFFAEVQVFSLFVFPGPESPGVDIWSATLTPCPAHECHRTISVASVALQRLLYISEHF